MKSLSRIGGAIRMVLKDMDRSKEAGDSLALADGAEVAQAGAAAEALDGAEAVAVDGIKDLIADADGELALKSGAHS